MRNRLVAGAVWVFAVGAVAALAGCSTPEPQPAHASSSGVGGGGGSEAASGAGGGSAKPTPTSPFALGPQARAALGDTYCVAVVRPRHPLAVADLVQRLGGDLPRVHLYDEGKDGADFRAGADDLNAATPGVDDEGVALYRVSEQSGAWTIYQAAGRRCIADATLTALTRDGGKAMAYTRDVDGEARLALAVDGTLLVNLNPGILPDESDRRGANLGALSEDDLSELRLAAEGEGDLDVPAAGLIERQCGVRLDDKWLAGPSQLVRVAGR